MYTFTRLANLDAMWAMQSSFFNFDQIVWPFSDTGLQQDKSVFAPEDDVLPGDNTTTTSISIGSFFGGAIDFDGDDDWLIFDPTAGDIVRFAAGIANTVISPIFRLYDDAGTIVLEHRAVDGAILNGTTELGLTFTFTSSSRYYLSISSETGSGVGNYNLSATFAGLLSGDDFSAGTSTAGIVMAGASASGTLQAEAYEDQDWFAITLSASETLEVIVDNIAYADLQIAFYDQDGNRIWNSGNALDFPNSNMLHYVNAYEAQTIYVAVSGPDGAYEFNTRVFTDDFAANPANTNPQSNLTQGVISVGETITGTINSIYDDDWFVIHLDPEAAIHIRLEDISGAADSLGITIYDEQGNSFGMPSAVGIAQTTFSLPEGGTFYISVAAQVGDYQLSVTAIQDDFTGNNSTLGAVNVGGVTTGQINFSTDVDSFAIQVAAGDIQRLDLAFDSELGYLAPIIRDADGNIVEPGFSLFQGSTFIYRFETAGTYYVDMRGGINAGSIAPMDYAFSVVTLDNYAIPAAANLIFNANAVLRSPIFDPGLTPTVDPQGLSINLREYVDENAVIHDDRFYRVKANDVHYATDGDALFLSESSGTLENFGTIWTESATLSATALNGLGWDTFTNEGTVVAIGHLSAGGFKSGGGAHLVNPGEIYAISYEFGSDAVSIFNGDDIGTVHENTGLIYAHSELGFARGVFFSTGAVINNSGDIIANGYSAASGIVLVEGGSVTNFGAITALTGSSAFSYGIRAAQIGLTVNNTGTITADIAIFGFSTDSVENSGVINGAILLYNDAFVVGTDDTLINSGDIFGIVDLAGNDDVFDNTNGTVFGNVYMGTGNDSATGGANMDYIYGENGDDTLSGGAGADYLNGGNGVDAIKGGAGNDRLLGGEGNDELYGDAGADSYIILANAGTDKIFGFENGTDQIVFGDGPYKFDQLKIYQDGTDVVILSANGVTVLIDIDIADIDASDFTFRLYPTAPHDPEAVSTPVISETTDTPKLDDVPVSEVYDIWNDFGMTETQYSTFMTTIEDILEAGYFRQDYHEYGFDDALISQDWFIDG